MIIDVDPSEIEIVNKQRSWIIEEQEEEGQQINNKELTPQKISEIINKKISTSDEPIRDLNNMDLDKLDGWSFIDPHEKMLLTRMDFIRKTFDVPLIRIQIIIPYLKFAGSVKGIAREQFVSAHAPLFDQLKAELAGYRNNNPQQQQNTG